MKRIDARKLRTAIGGGFVIQAEDGQQYITGRDWEWIYHLPAVEVFPVYSAGRVVGYAFKDTRKE
jgi:hypothetical protein